MKTIIIDGVEYAPISKQEKKGGLEYVIVRTYSAPENCKFPAEVPSVTLLEAIEILPVSEEAKKSIDLVKVWK